MGTQQILLIVLSVIIVGIAVAVGITMFNQQAFNSNRNACISDLNMFATQAMAWWKTPETHGGAANGNGTVTPDGDVDLLIEWIGFENAAGDGFLTGNGSYSITTNDGTDLVILAAGNEGTDPEMTLNWATGVWTIDLSASSS